MSLYTSQLLLVSLLCSLTAAACADAPPKEPHQVVQQTTEQVLEIIQNAKRYSTSTPDRFNTEITNVLEKVIDFDDFARGVMGSYASSKRYQALTSDADKAAFGERIQKFSITLKQSLINTYASNMMSFNGERVTTLPLQKGEDLIDGMATVIQHIFNETNKPYEIRYSMRRNKEGDWKIRNLIIEGINIGLTNRNQFAAAAENYKGDLDKVIANWKIDQANADTRKASESTPEAER
jgi:phospholipid transport system substrate-binding protein